MTVVLDAGRMNSRQDTHEYLREKLGFPEYYGGNLDALFDCLTEMRDTKVVFADFGGAGTYCMKVYAVFLRAAEENTGLRVETSDGLL